MEAIVKTRRVGGSVMATLPKNVVESLGIRDNELVRLDIKKPGKDFFGKLKGIGRFTRADKLDAHD